MTRFGIHRLVTRYAEQASRTVPSMATKRVSPHTIRHTTAVHLLRAGVDINTIRAWLGHVSLDTTHIYAEVDMEMKAKALARVDISEPANQAVAAAAAVADDVPESPIDPSRRRSNLCCGSCQGNQPSPWLTPHKPGRNITAVAVTLGMDLSVFLPKDRHRDARTLQLARQGGPVRLDPPPLALRDSGPPKQPGFQSLVGDVVGQAAMPARPPPPASDCPGSSSAPRRDVARSRARSPHRGEAAIDVAIVACSVPASPASRSPRRPSTAKARNRS